MSVSEEFFQTFARRSEISKPRKAHNITNSYHLSRANAGPKKLLFNAKRYPPTKKPLTLKGKKKIALPSNNSKTNKTMLIITQAWKTKTMVMK